MRTSAALVWLAATFVVAHGEEEHSDSIVPVNSAVDIPETVVISTAVSSAVDHAETAIDHAETAIDHVETGVDPVETAVDYAETAVLDNAVISSAVAPVDPVETLILTSATSFAPVQSSVPFSVNSTMTTSTKISETGDGKTSATSTGNSTGQDGGKSSVDENGAIGNAPWNVALVGVAVVSFALL